MNQYCEDGRFDKAVISHNRREKHIDEHKMLISSMQWHPIIHYGMTTAHNILNIRRAMNAGECTFHTDGTFNIRGMIAFVGIRVAQRCDETATVGFSVNPSELEEAIRATFNGLQACFLLYLIT